MSGKPTKRTRILYRDSGRAHKIVPVWNPMSILHMALLSILWLTLAHKASAAVPMKLGISLTHAHSCLFEA